MKRGEEISYQFTLDEAKRLNNKKAIEQLQKIGHPPYPKMKDQGIQRKWLSKFQGATFRGTMAGTVFKNVSFKDTRPLDTFRIIMGAAFSLKCFDEQLVELSILNEVPEINVPVYFCTGRSDYHVPFELVIEYLEKLRAPKKEIIWFEQSGHLPNFEEPEKFCDFCISLLEKE